MSQTSTSQQTEITIVTGLPRSGTSMMMRMLEAGGIPAMIDNIRTPDPDNPRGYYEFEAVKRTKDDPSWIADAGGKVVKMVYRLLYDMPVERHYKVLFMRRQMSEILASQRVMLERNGKADQVNDEEMAMLFASQLADFETWLEEQSHLDVLQVSYNQVLEDPATECKRIGTFLDRPLDEGTMASIVEQALYRNRS